MKGGTASLASVEVFSVSVVAVDESLHCAFGMDGSDGGVGTVVALDGRYLLGSDLLAVEALVVDSEASFKLGASVASGVRAGGTVVLFGSGRGVAGGCHISRNVSIAL